jgi:hypothetical protein
MKSNAHLQGEIIAKERKKNKRSANSIKLSANHSWVKGIQVCSKVGPDRFQSEDNGKNRIGSFKNVLLKNRLARNDQIYMEAF